MCRNCGVNANANPRRRRTLHDDSGGVGDFGGEGYSLAGRIIPKAVVPHTGIYDKLGGEAGIQTLDGGVCFDLKAES